MKIKEKNTMTKWYISKYKFREIYLQYFFFKLFEKKTKFVANKRTNFPRWIEILKRDAPHTVAEGNIKFLKQG